MNYKEYIKSDKWRVRSRLYRNAHPRCEICGCADKFRLHTHHVSYENLGSESDDDLMTLCQDCHDGIESIKNFTEESYSECAGFIASHDYDEYSIKRALGRYESLYEIIMSYQIRKCLTCSNCMVFNDGMAACIHGEGCSYISDITESIDTPCRYYEKGTAELPYKENEPVLVSFDGETYEQRLFSTEKYLKGVVGGWSTHVAIRPVKPHDCIKELNASIPVLHYEVLNDRYANINSDVADPMRIAIQKKFRQTYPSANESEMIACYEYCKQRVDGLEHEVKGEPKDWNDIGVKKLRKTEITVDQLLGKNAGFAFFLLAPNLPDYIINRILGGLNGKDDRITYVKESCDDLNDYWFISLGEGFEDWWICHSAIRVTRYLLELIDCYKDKYPNLVHNARVIAVVMMLGINERYIDEIKKQI